MLTSYDDADATEAGYAGSVADLVAARTAQAREIGIGGIVCAATEAARVRAIVGPDRLIVTPGIRPAASATGDQKRIVTPATAIRAGADYLVVGRPVTAAADAARGRRRHRRRDRLGAVTRTGDTIARDRFQDVEHAVLPKSGVHFSAACSKKARAGREHDADIMLTFLGVDGGSRVSIEPIATHRDRGQEPTDG